MSIDDGGSEPTPRGSEPSPLKPVAREPAPSETSTVACTDVSSLFSTSLRDTIARVQLVLMRHLRDGRQDENAKVSLTFDEAKFRRKKWKVLHPVLTPHTGSLTCFKTRAQEAEDAPPTGEDVRQFIVRFARRGLVSSESLTISLIYVQRLIALGIRLIGRTWRPIVLGAIIVAAKLWEDRPCWNVEFTTKDMQVVHVNALERHFCKVLKYRLHVNAGEYARYHFALRAASPAGPETQARQNFRSKLASRVGVLGRASPNAQPAQPALPVPPDRFTL